eukprot:COSAG05_NODE_24163_length_253_cov_0.824675_1_plen_26_part_01
MVGTNIGLQLYLAIMPTLRHPASVQA